MWKRTIACALAVLWVTGGPAAAQEPRELSSQTALPTGMGAIRLSLRSQLQLPETLHLWFLPAREGAVDSKEGLRFERKQGVPLAGSNMIDSRPRVYSVRPGRYRLAAHVTGCEQLPPPGTVCSKNWNPLPTGTYLQESVTFEVRAGELTDAGEFVLELPPSVDLGGTVSFREGLKQMRDAQIRWRKIATPIPAAFTAMKLGATPEVPAAMQSHLQCEIKPRSAKGMMLFYPFSC